MTSTSRSATVLVTIGGRGRTLFIKRLAVAVAVVGVALANSSPSVAQTSDSTVVFAETSTAASEPTMSRNELRTRLVEVDRRRIAATLQESSVAVALVDGPPVTFQTVRTTWSQPLASNEQGAVVPGPQVLSWAGEQWIDGTQTGWATLTLVRNLDGAFDVTGSAAVGSRNYSIAPVSGNVHRITEVDVRPTKRDGGQPIERRAPHSPANKTSADSPGVSTMALASSSVIDVVVGYSNGNGTNAFSFILNAISELNTAFTNSDMAGTSVNLVAVVAVNYNQASTYELDLDRLRRGVGNLHVLRSMRETLGADLVALMLPSDSNHSGLADTPPAGGSFVSAFGTFSKSSSGVGNWAMQHELGHMLGANHNPENAAANAGPYTYSRGHYVPSVAADLMTYTSVCGTSTPCPYKLQFSSPTRNFIGTGHPSGTTARDNHASMLNLRTPVANYIQPTTAFTNTSGGISTYRPNGGLASTGHTSAAGSNVAVTGLSTYSHTVAYRNSVGNLVLYSPYIGGYDTGLGVAPNTSPAIALLPDNNQLVNPQPSWAGSIVAFQGNNGNLYTYSNGSFTNTMLGMKSGTSPSITPSMSTSGPLYHVAFQANNGNLYTYSTSGFFNTVLGMATNTSPAIASSPSGSFQVAFQANTGSLYTYTPANGGFNTGGGMAANSSPAISRTNSSTGYAMAFRANTGNLFILTTNGFFDTTQTMATNTSPGIASTTPDDYFAVYQGSDSNLRTFASGGTVTNTGQAMASGRSPSLSLST